MARRTYALATMFRGKLLLVQQSRDLTTRYGAVIGLVTGLASSVGAVVIAPRYSDGAVSVLMTNDLGVVVVAVVFGAIGALGGFLLGAAEASFVAVSADAIADRNASLSVLFGVLTAPLLVINTTLTMAACVTLLGYSDTSSWEIAPLAFTALVTISAVAVYTWAQSLDWPAKVTLPSGSYGDIDLTTSTRENRDLKSSLRSRLEDVN